MCPVGLTVWFVCKSCNVFFAQIDDFIEHKKESHFTEFQVQNTSCIVFEERTDGNFDNERSCVEMETKPIILKEEFQLANDSRFGTKDGPNLPVQIVDIIAQRNEYICEDSESPSNEILVPKTELVTYDGQIQDTETSSFGSFQPEPERIPHALNQHQNQAEKRLKCEFCMQPHYFSTLQTRRKHFRLFHPELRQQCSSCKVVNGIWPFDVQSHDDVFHRADKSEFNCKRCNQNLGSAKALRVHMKSCILKPLLGSI